MCTVAVNVNGSKSCIDNYCRCNVNSAIYFHDTVWNSYSKIIQEILSKYKQYTLIEEIQQISCVIWNFSKIQSKKGSILILFTPIPDCSIRVCHCFNRIPYTAKHSRRKTFVVGIENDRSQENIRGLIMNSI